MESIRDFFVKPIQEDFLGDLRSEFHLEDFISSRIRRIRSISSRSSGGGGVVVGAHGRNMRQSVAVQPTTVAMRGCASSLARTAHGIGCETARS